MIWDRILQALPGFGGSTAKWKLPFYQRICILYLLKEIFWIYFERFRNHILLSCILKKKNVRIYSFAGGQPLHDPLIHSPCSMLRTQSHRTLEKGSLPFRFCLVQPMGSASKRPEVSRSQLPPFQVPSLFSKATAPPSHPLPTAAFLGIR